MGLLYNLLLVLIIIQNQFLFFGHYILCFLISIMFLIILQPLLKLLGLQHLFWWILKLILRLIQNVVGCLVFVFPFIFHID